MLSRFRGVICIPYLGDVLVYSKSFDDHLVDIQMVLKRLREHGVKLSPGKCKLFEGEAKYLAPSMDTELMVQVMNTFWRTT